MFLPMLFWLIAILNGELTVLFDGVTDWQIVVQTSLWIAFLIVHSMVDEELSKWAGVTTCEICTLNECRPCSDEEKKEKEKNVIELYTVKKEDVW